jgi:hypothetical protein
MPASDKKLPRPLPHQEFLPAFQHRSLRRLCTVERRVTTPAVRPGTSLVTSSLFFNWNIFACCAEKPPDQRH